MRAYISADGLIVQSDKVLKWEGWREVTSVNPAPMPVCIRLKKREKKEPTENAVEEVAPVQQTDEIEEPQDNSPADDDDSDLEVPEEPKRGKRK